MPRRPFDECLQVLGEPAQRPPMNGAEVRRACALAGAAPDPKAPGAGREWPRKTKSHSGKPRSAAMRPCTAAKHVEFAVVFHHQDGYGAAVARLAQRGGLADDSTAHPEAWPAALGECPERTPRCAKSPPPRVAGCICAFLSGRDGRSITTTRSKRSTRFMVLVWRRLRSALLPKAIHPLSYQRVERWAKETAMPIGLLAYLSTLSGGRTNRASPQDGSRTAHRKRRRCTREDGSSTMPIVFFRVQSRTANHRRRQVRTEIIHLA
jgi:hypothetical protein